MKEPRNDVVTNSNECYQIVVLKKWLIAGVRQEMPQLSLETHVYSKKAIKEHSG